MLLRLEKASERWIALLTEMGRLEVDIEDNRSECVMIPSVNYGRFRGCRIGTDCDDI
jgi:hypothetical protein